MESDCILGLAQSLWQKQAAAVAPRLEWLEIQQDVEKV